METELAKGYRVVGAVVSLAAAGNAAAVAIFTRSVSPLQIGTKSFKIKKIMVHDNGTGGTRVHIGTGVAGAVVDVMPTIQTVSNMDAEWGEADLPDIEVFANLMAWPVAVGGSTIDIQVEVEEIG